MKQVYLSVSATSPLAIRSDHAEGGSATAKYIPATTLMGGLAAAHRALRPEKQDEFAKLFLQEQVLYPALYPAFFKKSGIDIDTSHQPVCPFPKTAQSCKRFQGFLPVPGEDTKDIRHGVRDSLLDWGIFSLLDNGQTTIKELLAPLNVQENCTVSGCIYALDHIDGYYRRSQSNPASRMKATVKTRLQTRTGINRTWGVVEEGILYNREVFEEGMCFWGSVILPDDYSDTFIRFVEEAKQEDIIRLGTGRTRGLGCVCIEQVFEAKREDSTQFSNRLKNFHTTFRNRADLPNMKPLAPFYFAVTLYSPAIIHDNFLRYRQTLDAQTLSDSLGYPDLKLTPIYHATEMQQITGWNELWGTPRPNDYALATGSVFLFACARELDAQLVEALYALEENGIGSRRAEGFGRICISDPFHLEGEQS